MRSYLLTYNPQSWTWKNIEKARAELKKRGRHDRDWSLANTTKPKSGDRFFLLKQGAEPRGIIGSGVFIGGRKPGHGRLQMIRVRFLTLLPPPDKPFPRARLNSQTAMYWDTPGGGVEIPEGVASWLDKQWINFQKRDGLTGLHNNRSKEDTAAIAKDMRFYDEKYTRRAKKILPLLVVQANAGKTILYGQLAKRIGAFHRVLNFALGSIGTTLRNLEKDLGPIPPLQALVVRQATGEPGIGFDWFLRYGRSKELPLHNKHELIKAVWGEVFAYRGWGAVLRKLGLRKASIRALSIPTSVQRKFEKNRESQYWVLKTTAGGYTDYWKEFMSEQVLALGWRYKKPPSEYGSIKQFVEREGLDDHAARTIHCFHSRWSEGDTIILAKGFNPTQNAPVRVYGIARAGKYFYDHNSNWWHAKREAIICPIDRLVPVDVLRRIFGKSQRSTIHSITAEQFALFSEEIKRCFPEGWDGNTDALKNRTVRNGRKDKSQRPSPSEFYEGGLKPVENNAYERDPKVRRECLREHGYSCKICKKRMVEIYGSAAEGFIHVHHLVPLSTNKKAAKINPKKDVIPVCPDCHSIIHRTRTPRTLEEMLILIKEAQGNQ